MDAVVAHTILRIDAQIDRISAEQGDGSHDCQLLSGIRDDFAILFSLVSYPRAMIQFDYFCRRLARLMDYNPPLKTKAWRDLQQGLLCLLRRDTTSVDKHNYTRFASLLKLEGRMEERQAQFRKTVGKLNSLDEPLELHRNFLDRHLRKGLSLHSTLQVRNLIENVEDFLLHVYQPIIISAKMRHETLSTPRSDHRPTFRRHFIRLPI
jgi:hypothetical protein